MVYACSHAAWLRETIDSAASCRRHMPDLRRQLFIERTVYEARTHDLTVFDDVIVLDVLRHKHRPRFEATLMTDLDEAIFIDGDTLFLSPILEVFELFEHYDIAVTPAPQSFTMRGTKLGIYDAMPKVSEAQREWNTGFIAARIDDRFRELIGNWSALFATCEAKDVVWDQAPFRIALTQSRLRIASLPENYNFRANIPRFANGQIKVLHAHGDLPAIAAYINRNLEMRVYVPRPQEIYGTKPRELLG
jgi:hypothetical protein